MQSRSSAVSISTFCIGSLLLLNLGTCAVLKPAKNSADTTIDCGRRPVCTTFPLVCREFESKLLHGFSSAEVPFVARVIVSQRQPSGNDSTVCVAVLVSQNDLILSSKCYRPNANTDESGTIEVGWGATGESHPLHPTAIEHGRSSPFTIISEATKTGNIVSEVAQDACMESIPLFSFSGIICGFPIANSPDLSCRVVELSNSDSDQFPQLGAQQLNGLANGAAVFRRVTEGDQNENWRLIGFTNPDGKLSALTEDDCAKFSTRTHGRVQCVVNAPPDANITSLSEAIANEIDLPTVAEQWPNNSIEADGEEGGSSALIPAIIFGLILVLGVALCVLVARNSRTNAAYETI